MFSNIYYIYNLEEIYKNFSIYRALLIVNNLTDACILYYELYKKDHNPILYNDKIFIDYNKYRLIIIPKKFILKNNIFISTTYNIVFYYYNISYNTIKTINNILIN